VGFVNYNGQIMTENYTKYLINYRNVGLAAQAVGNEMIAFVLERDNLL